MPCLGPSWQRTQGNQGAYVSCIRLTTLPKFTTIADSYLWFYPESPHPETDNSYDDDCKHCRLKIFILDFIL